MIKKLFRVSNNPNHNYFRLIIERKNDPIYILYKHKYISLTPNNNIKLVHGNIYGFSIGNHEYINYKYGESKKSKTVMSSSIYMNHIYNENKKRVTYHLILSCDWIIIGSISESKLMIVGIVFFRVEGYTIV